MKHVEIQRRALSQLGVAELQKWNERNAKLIEEIADTRTQLEAHWPDMYSGNTVAIESWDGVARMIPTRYDTTLQRAKNRTEVYRRRVVKVIDEHNSIFGWDRELYAFNLQKELTDSYATFPAELRDDLRQMIDALQWFFDKKSGAVSLPRPPLQPTDTVAKRPAQPRPSVLPKKGCELHGVHPCILCAPWEFYPNPQPPQVGPEIHLVSPSVRGVTLTVIATVALSLIPFLLMIVL